MKEENEIIRCNKGARSERGKYLRVVKNIFMTAFKIYLCTIIYSNAYSKLHFCEHFVTVLLMKMFFMKIFS